VIHIGDDIVSLPSGKKSKIRSILTSEGEKTYAFTPQSVTLVLEDEIDASRGDMFVRPENIPDISHEFQAAVFWMSESPLIEKKSYLINVTAPTAQEMIRRAKFVKKMGGEFAMVDIITTGWNGVHTLREACQDLGLAVHAHRAMHGAMTRNEDHGFSMLCVAEVSRLLGVDILHIGTAGVGKLVGSADEVFEIQDHITKNKIVMNAKKRERHTLEEDWYGIKPILPCSSGGLHPGIIAEVFRRMGTDIALQLGGGVHGHPKGSHAGAKAMRQAWEAYEEGIRVEEYAKNRRELSEALKEWGHTHPR